MKAKLSILLIFLFNNVYSQPGWFIQNSGTTSELRSIWMLNENTGYTGGQNSQLLKTTNGGTNWTPLSVNLNNIFSVRFINENTGFCLGSSQAGDLYSAKTTDGGINWNLGFIDTVNTGASQFINANTGYTVDSTGIFKSTDGGSSWVLIHASNGILPTNLFFLNQNFGWVCGRNGMIRETTDGGLNWLIVNCGSLTNLRAVFFVSGFTGWAVGDDSRVYKTTNMGNNWSMISGNGLCGLRSVYFVTGSTGWVAGCEGAINRSTNSGVNWVLQSFATTAYLNDMKFVNSTTGWAVGYGGKILKTTNNGITPKNLQLTALIEGFYDNLTNTMTGDTVKVYLRNIFSPYPLVDSAKDYLNSSGAGSLNFQNAANSTSYYVIVKHRNSIETWGAGGNSFVNHSLTYNFTTSSAQAFGNNMKQKGSRWTVFSGDVNQDGFVDASDIGLIDNDAYNFVSGYINTDLNGDNIADGSDLGIADNNSFNFVSVIRP